MGERHMTAREMHGHLAAGNTKLVMEMIRAQQRELVGDAECVGGLLKHRKATIMGTCTHMVMFSMIAHAARENLEAGLEEAFKNVPKDKVNALLDACEMVKRLRGLHGEVRQLTMDLVCKVASDVADDYSGEVMADTIKLCVHTYNKAVGNK